ncbi:(2Fe-2S)-binding protein [Streptomyces siamensis]|uniref:Bacterioferritin-associated ferredoxin n=1 Tax=Streptomyces siamensis TaxID=1274986 RepID=A0ABP9ILS2_9ACTN
MFVCSCFGVTEAQVKKHAEEGACTPRQIASACKAGTDCGSCVRRIQALLGRGACPRRELADEGRPVLSDLVDAPVPAPVAMPATAMPATAALTVAALTAAAAEAA